MVKLTQFETKTSEITEAEIEMEKQNRRIKELEQ
jgi:chromosome segregation ATPase